MSTPADEIDFEKLAGATPDDDEGATGETSADPPPPVPKIDPEPPEHTVPVATLVSERREWNQEKNDLLQRLARLEPIADDIRQMKADKDEADKPATPEYLEDPKGYIDHSQRDIAQQLKEMGESVQQNKAITEQQTMIQNMQGHIAGIEDAYAKEHDDYWDALEYYRTIRRTQLLELVPQANAGQIEQRIKLEELNTASQLVQGGRNPSEYVYFLAKSMGYNPPEPDPKPDMDKEGGKPDAEGLGSAGDTSSALDDLMESLTDQRVIRLVGATTDASPRSCDKGCIVSCYETAALDLFSQTRTDNGYHRIWCKPSSCGKAVVPRPDEGGAKAHPGPEVHGQGFQLRHPDQDRDEQAGR